MIKVMVVEDDPMVMDITCKYVCSIEEFTVVARASSGTEALGYLKKEKVDLLILDIYMPVMNGEELLYKLRSKTINIDAIFLTAANDLKKIDIALKLGAVDYMVKPFSYERFRTAIENYKKRYRLLHEEQKAITQNQLDNTFGLTDQTENESIQKGLNEKTVNIIRSYIRSSTDKKIDMDGICSALAISKITVRRYLKYLSSTGEIILKVEYGGIGRPTYTFYKI